MGEIVNLNRFRKQAARRQAAAEAAANRTRFGRTGAQKARDADDTDRSRRGLDGKKLDEEPHC